MPEALSFELRGYGWFVQHGVVAFFGLGWRNVVDRLQQPAVVEPVRELDALEGAPWPAAMDHLSFVEAVDRFRESVVVAVTNAADRRFDASLRKTLSIFDRQVPGGIRSWSPDNLAQKAASPHGAA